jgi:hypothetical protein
MPRPLFQRHTVTPIASRPTFGGLLKFADAVSIDAVRASSVEIEIAAARES